VLRRVVPAQLALAACVLFAIDDAHALPVAWSASRAELIGFAFMIAALWAHVAWTARPSLRLRALAIASIGLGVLAGEHALALFAYVSAYALLGAPGTVRERVRGWAPLAPPVVLYMLLHAALGYGTSGSSFYSDPFSDAARYLHALPVRSTLLLGDAVFGYTAEWWFGLPPWWPGLAHARLPVAQLFGGDPRALQLAVGVTAWVLVLLGLRWAWRSKHTVAEALRWLLLGALASLPALCGTFAMTRLTVAPALGIDVGLAWILLLGWERLRAKGPLPARAAAACVAALVVLVHGQVAATRSHEASELYAAWSRNEDAWVARAELGGANVAAQHVMIVSAADIATQFSLPFVRYRHGQPMPASSQLLLPPAAAAIEVERIGANALELRSTAPSGHSGFRNSAYRLEANDFRAGQRFVTPQFAVEVVAVHAGDPTDLRFVFEKTLDDPSYVFLYPRPEGLIRLALPRARARLVLPPPAPPAPAP
jgi:hypothetical protein